MNAVITDGAAVWVHSCEDGTGGVKVSTQFLYVDSSVLASYQGSQAMEASANSYGGINTSAVYLQPSSANVRPGSVVVTPSGGSIENGGNTGGGNTDGNTSGTTEPETPGVIVAAPTFAGNTQFEETSQVSMSGPAGASIFYTLNGSTPTDQSLEYEGPITLSETTVVKAIAVKDGVSSSVTSRTYTKGTNAGGEGNGDMD